MPSSFAHWIDSVTSFSFSTRAYMSAMKAESSSGSIRPAASHSVIVVAPALIAVSTACATNSRSARAASPAVNSTSLHSSAQTFTCASISSRIFGPFLWAMYSICTGETGTETCRRGLLASFAISHTFFACSSSMPAWKDSTELFTVWQMARSSTASAGLAVSAGISITSTCSLSS